MLSSDLWCAVLPLRRQKGTRPLLAFSHSKSSRTQLELLLLGQARVASAALAEKLNDTPDLSSYSRFSKFGKSIKEP